MSILFSTEEAAHLIFWVSFLISVWKIEISFLAFVSQLSLYLKEVKCISALRYIEIFFWEIACQSPLNIPHNIFYREFYWLVTFLWQDADGSHLSLDSLILFIHQSSQALFFTLLDFFLSLTLQSFRHQRGRQTFQSEHPEQTGILSKKKKSKRKTANWHANLTKLASYSIPLNLLVSNSDQRCGVRQKEIGIKNETFDLALFLSSVLIQTLQIIHQSCWDFLCTRPLCQRKSRISTWDLTTYKGLPECPSAPQLGCKDPINTLRKREVWLMLR